MSAVNALIRAQDYNNIRSKVVGVLGTGSGTSGWGQTIASSAVATGVPSGTATRIGVQEYANLTTDINNAWDHIFGEYPTLPAPTEHNLVKFNNTTEPINRFNTIADTIVANKFTVNTFRTGTTDHGTTSATWPSATYGSFWNSRLNCTVNVTFSTATQARYFFNSGGRIRFFSERFDGASGRQQNAAWTSLLSAAGTREWGGNTPSTGTAPSNAENFYRLTNQAQTWYSRTGTTDYTALEYRIQASAPDLANGANNANGTARRIDFFISWIDGYTDPGDNPADPADPGDEVDGTIRLNVQTVYPEHALLPSGIFTIEIPTITVNSIQQLSNNARVTPSTYVPINAPPSTVNFAPSTVNAPPTVVSAPPQGLPGSFPLP